MKFVNYGLILSLLLTTTACSTQQMAQQDIDDAKETVTKHQEALKTDQIGAPAKQRVQVVDSIIMPTAKRVALNGDFLPSQFENSTWFINVPGAHDLTKIAQILTEQTGIIVYISPEIFSGDKNTAKSGQDAASKPVSQNTNYTSPNDIEKLASSLGIPANVNPTTNDAGFITKQYNTRDTMTVKHTGSLSSFLSLVANHYGISWEYNNGRIVFFKNTSLTFRINMAAAMPKIESAGGGDDTRVKPVDNKYLWDALQKDLETIVGEEGKINTSAEWGTVTVKAPVYVMDRVKRHIAGINRVMSKQITTDVEMITLTNTNNASTNIDILGAFRGSGANVINFGSTTTPNLELTGNPGATWSIIKPGSNWLGTSAVFAPLETQGVSVSSKKITLSTVNGTGVSWLAKQKLGFVKKISVTKDQENGTSVELDPGTVTVGYDVNLTPRLMNDYRTVMLTLNMNISQLNGAEKGFDRFTSGDATVQQENILSTSTFQNVNVPNDAIFVSAGYVQSDSGKSKTDAGLNFPLLGYKDSANANNSIVVLVIRPRVIDTANFIETER